jgi:hypothetical protein
VTLANYIPAIVKELSAVIVQNNLEPTRLTYSLTDNFLKGSAGKILAEGAKELRN